MTVSAAAWAERRRAASIVAMPVVATAARRSAPRARKPLARAAPTLSLTVPLTPSEHSLLQRVLRFKVRAEQASGSASLLLVEALGALVDLVSEIGPGDLPDKMRGYRAAWDGEQERHRARVRAGEIAWAAVDEVCETLGWTRQEAARFAIRHLHDSLDVQKDLGPVQACKRDVPFSKGKNDELIRRFQAGDRAAGDALLRANDGLVWVWVKRYRGNGLEDEDLAQSGRIGLLKAIERFDLSRGLSLSTYAGWWIRTTMKRALQDEGATIRVPAHLQTALWKELRAGRDLSPSLVKARSLLTMGSLDDPIDDDRALSEIVASPLDDQERLVGDAEASELARSVVEEAVKVLSEREMTVLRRRGLAEDTEPLERVAETLGVTRQRVSQIEMRAMTKLRRALEGAVSRRP